MKVEQLPSGTFRVRIMIDGHRYTFTDKDKKRVKAMAASFADEHREAVENPTLQAAMEKYIEGRSKIRSESTIRGYDTIYRMMLDRYPDLCQKRVTNIRQSDLQNVVDTMDREPKTIKNYIGFLQSAIEQKYKLILPQTKKPKVSIPNDMEIAGLIRVAENMYPDLVIPIMLGAFGPLRRGEICALTLTDFEGDFVNITKDVIKDKDGNFILKPVPKTVESNRRIQLPHFVVAKIRKQGYVTKLSPVNVSTYFRRMQSRIGLEDVCTFHSTRHYFVSTLHANGLPDETAALTDRAQNIKRKPLDTSDGA